MSTTATGPRLDANTRPSRRAPAAAARVADDLRQAVCTLEHRAANDPERVEKGDRARSMPDNDALRPHETANPDVSAWGEIRKPVFRRL